MMFRRTLKYNSGGSVITDLDIVDDISLEELPFNNHLRVGLETDLVTKVTVELTTGATMIYEKANDETRGNT